MDEAAYRERLLALAREGQGAAAADLNATQVEEARGRVAAWLMEQGTA